MKKFTLLLVLLLAVVGVKADVEWTIWEGTATGTNVQIVSADFTNIAADEKLYVYATGTTEKKLAKQTGDGWNWTEITASFTPTNDGTNYYYTVDASLLAVINATDFKALNFVNDDGGGTITKVVIKKKTSMIKTVAWTGTQNFASWSGVGIEAEHLSGLVNNDYLYVKATRNSGESDFQFQFQDWSSEETKYSAISGSGFSHDYWAIVSDASLVSTHKMGATGCNYTITEVSYLHPVTSFSIGSIGMATFCANVPVSVPTGIEAYYATVNGEKTAITLTKIESGEIPANTGVIIKGDAGSVVEFTALSSEPAAVTSDLVGVTSETTMTAGDYVLYNNSGTAEFRKVTATNLAANKAYLPASKLSETPAHLGIIFDEGETTAISEMKAQQTVINDGAYYNLAGQRVDKPIKGLYIVNGKKVVIK